jgi:pimeloyl-ACP methyl ester carboxylesterase
MMTSQTLASATATAPNPRYRRSEWALWNHYGLEPTERFIDLDTPSARLRVLEVGAGEPLLFVHGTVGPGGWPALISELPDFRCLVLDRPGWGLSSPVDYSKHEYGTVVADILRGVLDALDVEKAHVVGGSIGNVWALRLAEQRQARVGRVVLMGGSPLVPQVTVPGFIRLIASPLGALMVRLPDKPERVRSILRHNGHGASLDAGRIPDQFIDWRMALGRHTDSMRHERDMIRNIVSGRAFRRGLTFADRELTTIQTPTLQIFGTADPVGTVDTWSRAIGLLPHGGLRVIDGAGHMPWFDNPTGIAADVRSWASAGENPATG